MILNSNDHFFPCFFEAFCVHLDLTVQVTIKKPCVPFLREQSTAQRRSKHQTTIKQKWDTGISLKSKSKILNKQEQCALRKVATSFSLLFMHDRARMNEVHPPLPGPLSLSLWRLQRDASLRHLNMWSISIWWHLIHFECHNIRG